MPLLDVVTAIVVRAASLFALAAAPPFFSPEPSQTGQSVEAVLAAALLAAVVLGAMRLRAKLGSRVALAGAALMIASVVASIAGAALFRGARAPLGQGVMGVAIPLWAGLAMVAAAVAEKRLGEGFRHKGLVAAVVVVCAGAALIASSARWIFSPQEMWWEALRKDGGNTVAVEAIVRDSMAKRDLRGASAALDRCLAVSPGACACLARRSEIGVRIGSSEQALVDARAAVAGCATDPAARAALIGAIANRGDGVEAEHEARVALATRDDPRFHYGLAVAYDKQGRTAEAIVEAKRAVEGGAGRDASVLLGMLAINALDLDGAEKALLPVVAADPNDAEALYDLGLVAHRKNNYNGARERYLSAIRANPMMLDARFNLVLLTIDKGVIDEARHHARKFAESAPNDPRNADLARRIATASAMKR